MLNVNRILIMGLPGSGKTTLAEKLTMELCKNYPAQHVNGDEVRAEADDWDFSEEGRIRQAWRMRMLSDKSWQMGVIAVCDFVCPTVRTSEIMAADFVIWMDTVRRSKYKDTNKIFQKPTEDEYNIRVDSFNSDSWSETLADLIYILQPDNAGH